MNQLENKNNNNKNKNINNNNSSNSLVFGRWPQTKILKEACWLEWLSYDLFFAELFAQAFAALHLRNPLH